MSLDDRLLPTRDSGRGDYAVARWYFLDLPPGTKPEHVEDPDFWVHMAARFRVHDEIIAIAADGSFEAELRVVAIDPRKLWAQVRPLRVWRGEAAASENAAPRTDPDGYKIEFSGPHKWRIVNVAGDVVAKDFATETDARRALQNIKAMKPKKAAA